MVGQHYELSKEVMAGLLACAHSTVSKSLSAAISFLWDVPWLLLHLRKLQANLPDDLGGALVFDEFHA